MPFTYDLQPVGVRRSDGACIPPDEGNRDWQEYLLWVAGGGVPTPLPAETPAQALSRQLSPTDREMPRPLEDLLGVLATAAPAIFSAWKAAAPSALAILNQRRVIRGQAPL